MEAGIRMRLRMLRSRDWVTNILVFENLEWFN
jgi:hypothetical protein